MAHHLAVKEGRHLAVPVHCLVGIGEGERYALHLLLGDDCLPLLKNLGWRKALEVKVRARKPKVAV